MFNNVSPQNYMSICNLRMISYMEKGSLITQLSLGPGDGDHPGIGVAGIQGSGSL